jgi:hypothetical protein
LYLARVLALVAIMLPHVPWCVFLARSEGASTQRASLATKLCPCCCCCAEGSPETSEERTPPHDCPAKIPCHYCSTFPITAPAPFMVPFLEAVVLEAVILAGPARFTLGYPESIDRPPRQRC